MRVLIVDDQEMERVLYVNYLSKLASCDFADNGVTALEKFTHALDNYKNFNLICLDIHLPTIGGYEVLQNIRLEENKRDVKKQDRVRIIIMSALDPNPDVRTMLEDDCEAYLVKPISREKLLLCMDRIGIDLNQGV